MRIKSKNGCFIVRHGKGIAIYRGFRRVFVCRNVAEAREVVAGLDV